jgi:hypothetical protein
VPGLPEECLSASERRKWATEAAWRAWADAAAVAPGTKIHYETAKGKCTVVRIRDGRLLEIRRFGSTFIPRGHVSGGRVIYHPYKDRRKFATEAEWRVWVDSEVEGAAPASPEARFWTRIQDIPCNRIFQLPPATASSPQWGNADLSIVWLYVQTDHGLIPVCRNWKGGVLRFMVNGEPRTFTEAGVAVDAPLWCRRDGADPTLVPV